MAELKTQQTGASVSKFIASLEDAAQRADCRSLVKLMKAVTKAPAKMWGPSIVGFGSYRYRYASGRTGEWMLTGFSPRKGNLSIYIMPGFAEQGALMKKLGRHKTGKSCLYVQRLDDVDASVLESLVARSVAWMKRTHGES